MKINFTERKRQISASFPLNRESATSSNETCLKIRASQTKCSYKHIVLDYFQIFYFEPFL